MAKGLDVGTSYIVLSQKTSHSTVEYKEFRDAFYVIKPSSQVAIKMIEKGLSGKVFVKNEEDNSFIVLGQDAIDKAIEKNESAKRPMYKGVISPKEKDSRKILSYIIKEVVGNPSTRDEKIVFCVPAQPIDQDNDDFDISYHEDVVKNILKSIGYNPRSINEAEALCYSELEDSDYTGIALSWGAGMVNVCIMLNGEPTSSFSTTKSGDWIDRMVASATAEPDSVVQSVKESSNFIIGQISNNPIESAISTYYERLIDYTAKHLTMALSTNRNLPKFKQPLKIVVAGGTAQAQGFVETFQKSLQSNKFPVPLKEVILANDPLHAVSKGCLIAANVL
jgi:hypothetical protein